MKTILFVVVASLVFVSVAAAQDYPIVVVVRPVSGPDASIPLAGRPVPFVNPFAALAEGRAMAEDSILRQQQIAINRQLLGPCPPVLGPGERWIPDVINPFSSKAPELRRQRAAQRARAAQAQIGCAVIPALVEVR